MKLPLRKGRSSNSCGKPEQQAGSGLLLAMAAALGALLLAVQLVRRQIGIP